MTGAADLIASERGFAFLALVLLVTVLVIIGRVTGAEWLAYTQWALTAIIAGKTVSGVVETLRSEKAS